MNKKLIAVIVAATVATGCAAGIASLYGHIENVSVLGVNDSTIWDAQGFATALTVGPNDYQLVVDSGIHFDVYTY